MQSCALDLFDHWVSASTIPYWNSTQKKTTHTHTSWCRYRDAALSATVDLTIAAALAIQHVRIRFQNVCGNKSEKHTKERMKYGVQQSVAVALTFDMYQCVAAAFVWQTGAKRAQKCIKMFRVFFFQFCLQRSQIQFGILHRIRSRFLYYKKQKQKIHQLIRIDRPTTLYGNRILSKSHLIFFYVSFHFFTLKDYARTIKFN